MWSIQVTGLSSHFDFFSLALLEQVFNIDFIASSGRDVSSSNRLHNRVLVATRDEYLPTYYAQMDRLPSSREQLVEACYCGQWPSPQRMRGSSSSSESFLYPKERYRVLILLGFCFCIGSFSFFPLGSIHCFDSGMMFTKSRSKILFFNKSPRIALLQLIQ